VTAIGDVTLEAIGDHVATVEINRPPNNFFDASLIANLCEAFETVDNDRDLRAIVLCSEGKHFCAGANLQEDRSDLNVGGADHLYVAAVRLFSCRAPVVAAVQGAAVGGGLGLAMVGDFRVACPEARFTANFSLLGFHQGFGLSETLPRAIGNQKALELLYTGKRIGGEEAFAIGLADRLVRQAEVRSAAQAFAAEIAAAAPLAVDSIRETMRGDLAEKVRVATDRELAEQNRLQQTKDFREGVKAMAERRKPEFKGE